MQLNDLMTEIAATTSEQAAALGEINAAISQMDETTQRNAAMVQEANIATQSLFSEAEKLVVQVSQFETQDAAAPEGPVQGVAGWARQSAESMAAD